MPYFMTKHSKSIVLYLVFSKDSFLLMHRTMYLTPPTSCDKMRPVLCTICWIAGHRKFNRGLLLEILVKVLVSVLHSLDGIWCSIYSSLKQACDVQIVRHKPTIVLKQSSSQFLSPPAPFRVCQEFHLSQGSDDSSGMLHMQHIVAA